MESETLGLRVIQESLEKSVATARLLRQEIVTGEAFALDPETHHRQKLIATSQVKEMRVRLVSF